MDEERSEPNLQVEAGSGATTFSLLQRLLAGIALVALLASAAISSWWILDGRVDFVDEPGGMARTAGNPAEARTPPDQRKP